MNKSFKNLDDLFAYIETAIQDTMENEVADMVKEKMNLSVHKTVYGTYQPKFYHRRKDNGGLSDKDNISITPINNGIEITNDTPLDNGRHSPRLDAIVEYGQGRQPFPRPFYEETYDTLAAGAFEETLKSSLKNKGIDIK